MTEDYECYVDGRPECCSLGNNYEFCPSLGGGIFPPCNNLVNDDDDDGDDDDDDGSFTASYCLNQPSFNCYIGGLPECCMIGTSGEFCPMMQPPCNIILLDDDDDDDDDEDESDDDGDDDDDDDDYDNSVLDNDDDDDDDDVKNEDDDDDDDVKNEDDDDDDDDKNNDGYDDDDDDSVPVFRPTFAPIPASVPFPACDICGNGRPVGNPNAIVNYPGETGVRCGDLQSAGLNGSITPSECSIF